MKKQSAETKRPFTVEEHKELGRIHAEKKISAVNDALGFPTGDAFDEELDSILNSDAEANGEVVAIALIDCDRFDHINKDFSREEGDRVLIEGRAYLRESRNEEIRPELTVTVSGTFRLGRRRVQRKTAALIPQE